MMSKKRVCWPLVVPVMAGVLLICAVPAHASHWEVSYKVNGLNRNAPQGTVQEEPWSAMYPGEFPATSGYGGYWWDDVEFYSYPSYLEVDSGGDYPGLTSKIEGTVTVILTWTKDDGEVDFAPTPKVVGIDVTGEAGASYSGQDSQSEVSVTMGEKSQDEGANGGIYRSNEDSTHYPATSYLPEHWNHSAAVGGIYFRFKPVPQGGLISRRKGCSGHHLEARRQGS